MESLYSYIDISSYYSGNNAEPDLGLSDITMFGGHTFSKENHKKFLEDFKSLFWFSYRRDFHPITNTNYTSDAGWGCMLRSGQMMLSQAFIRHLLGNDSRSTEQINKAAYRILKMFEDNVSSPFSIQRIASVGVRYGKNVGEWFAPSTVSQVLSDLLRVQQPENLACYVAKDAVLYLDEIRLLCSTPVTPFWKSILILIPLRLGIENVNDVYLPHLKSIFNYPQSLGIIGGKPRAAMYFVAYQDNNIFYLDPHIVQPSQVITEDSVKCFETYHCSLPQKMPFSSLDPSLAIGFYCSNKKDFDNFWSHAKSMSQQDNPLFTVEDEAPEYVRQQNNKKDLSFEEFEDDIVLL